MKQIKTSELAGMALDWAVWKIEHSRAKTDDELLAALVQDYCPSSNWSQGGPIIEREGILLRAIRKEGHTLDGQWLAMKDGTNTGAMVQWVKREDWKGHYLQGETALIAAMRCYVASKMGDVVSIPDELC